MGRGRKGGSEEVVGAWREGCGGGRAGVGRGPIE